ncbi:MAG: sigma-70 family RNA polymerase sigma factor [Chloroflexota bacterium]
MMKALIPLICRAQSGDADAYGALVARFQNMVYGYAYAILNDFDLAQDAAQEAFIDAYRCLPTLHEPLAFPAWLKRIVFKHCDRLTRRKSFEAVSLESTDDLICTRPGPPEIAERNEVVRQVQAGLRALPEGLRAVTTLFYVGGYSHAEISAFLDLPAKTVKSRLHAARQRLKERMLEMVQEELEYNALPEQFTHETVVQAIGRAAICNQKRQFDEAESLLREVLVKAPAHPEALKELNRAVMGGRVYRQGRWDLLRELAEQGKTILHTHMDDEEVHCQIAHTLLAIPAMHEAIPFLEKWIALKGPTLQRLGMLAWAKACTADYETAEKLWLETLALAATASANEALARIPFVAYTLIDCFSEAGKLPAAQQIARQAWEMCGHLGPLPGTETFSNDSDWLMLWHQARLDIQEIIDTLLARHQGEADPVSQAIVLSLRGWVDDAHAVIANGLAWVQARTANEEWQLLESFRFALLRGLRGSGRWDEANQLAEEIWQLLGKIGSPEAEKARVPWDWERFNPFGAISTKDWAKAQEIVQRELQERGIQAGGWAILVAAGRGTPAPAELSAAAERDGVDSVCDYGMFGWYLIARQAAATGDTAEAFDALQKALAYWTNPPFSTSDIFENDAYWGELRQHPEFRRAFDERRQRIGPVYGMLHYFPRW